MAKIIFIVEESYAIVESLNRITEIIDTYRSNRILVILNGLNIS